MVNEESAVPDLIDRTPGVVFDIVVNTVVIHLAFYATLFITFEIDSIGLLSAVSTGFVIAAISVTAVHRYRDRHGDES